MGRARSHPPAFRRPAVELARAGKTPIGQLAKDVGISYSCLRHQVDQAEVDDGVKQGLSTEEKAEPAALWRRTRQLELENEILRKAAACSASTRTTTTTIAQTAPSARPHPGARRQTTWSTSTRCASDDEIEPEA